MEVYKIAKNLKVILSQFTPRKLILLDYLILALNLHKSTYNFVFSFFLIKCGVGNYIEKRRGNEFETKR